MDIYTRFNRKSIQDRQVDTLIGLSKGILADGTVNQAEAEYLLNWLQQNRQASDNPVVLNLLEKVSNMLEDGILDKDESLELLGVLQNVSGESPVFGEIAKTTSLPLNNPMPEIVFQGKSFLFTGTCAFGNRGSVKQSWSVLVGKM